MSNDPARRGPSELQCSLRLAVAVAANIVVSLFSSRLFLHKSVVGDLTSKLLRSALCTIGLIAVVPVIRSNDFPDRLSAIMLSLLPAFVLLGCVWTLFESWR